MAQGTPDSFSGHKIVLVGHSYGGVIARSVLAAGSGRGFGVDNLVRQKILGLIQFGSPNGGSRAAEVANGEMHGLRATVWKNLFDTDGASDATRQRPSNDGTGIIQATSIEIVRGGSTAGDAQAQQPRAEARGHGTSPATA